MNDERARELLEPLAQSRWPPEEHAASRERLGREIRRELTSASSVGKRRLRNAPWLAFVFGSGLLCGVGIANSLPYFGLTFVGEQGERQGVQLRPLNGMSERPPIGILRSEDGQYFRVQEVDGELIMRAVSSDGAKVGESGR